MDALKLSEVRVLLRNQEIKNAHRSSVLNVFIVRSPFGLSILVHVWRERSCDAVSTYRAFSLPRRAVVGHIVRF